MELSVLREQETGKLEDINVSIGNLLAFRSVLSAELCSQVEALRAEVTAILEDRHTWTSLD